LFDGGAGVKGSLVARRIRDRLPSLTAIGMDPSCTFSRRRRDYTFGLSARSVS
jgi:hypothetical protein